MPRGFYPMDHGSFWWVGGLFGLLIVIAVVVGIIFIVREVLNRPAHRMSPPTATPLTRATEELDMRYARGEIGREEWQQRRHDLLHGPFGAPPPPGAGGPGGAPPGSPGGAAPPPA